MPFRDTGSPLLIRLARSYNTCWIVDLPLFLFLAGKDPTGQLKSAATGVGSSYGVVVLLLVPAKVALKIFLKVK